MHDWPPTRRNFMATEPSTAAFKSASSKMMKGALPPSSKDSRLIERAAVSMIPFPTSVEPVKPILRMRGCVRSSVHPLIRDRKSTRLNSSHSQISYAVFCLKKKKEYCYKHYNMRLYANNCRVAAKSL